MNDPNAIRITVDTQYLEWESDPEDNHYVFAYTIRIHNRSDTPVQLLNRYWRVTDGHEDVREVAGAGVIGEQPRLGPGEQFQYTSGAALPTPVGTMEGHYEMVTDAGERFRVPIARFSLICPGALH